MGDRVDDGYLQDGEKLYFTFRNREHVGNEEAKINTKGNGLEYGGRVLSTTGLARILIHKYKLSDLNNFQGPLYWMTSKKKLLTEIDEEIRKADTRLR